MATDPAAPIDPRSSKPLSLDELIALTDEMAALTRAGVPLENGLSQVAVDLSRHPAEVAANLSHRLKRGESLSDALAASPNTFPPAYCAVVEAGLRGGNLPAALEGLVDNARRTSELRRVTRVAMLYPVFLAFLAYGLFVCGIVWLQPRVTSTYEVMDLPPSALNLRLADLGRTAPTWVAWIPLVGLVIFAVWWYRSARGVARPFILRFLPAGRLHYYSHLAIFADLLALLIKHNTPLSEAVVLAANAGGDRRLQRSAHEFAEMLAAGVNPATLSSEAAGTHPKLSGFPPLVSWLLIGGGTQSTLVDALRSTARVYHRRVERLDDWLRLYLPLVITLAIGGTAVVIYALSLLGPWYEMLTHIGDTLR